MTARKTILRVRIENDNFTNTKQTNIFRVLKKTSYFIGTVSHENANDFMKFERLVIAERATFTTDTKFDVDPVLQSEEKQ